MNNNHPIIWEGGVEGLFRPEYGRALANTFMEGPAVNQLLRAVCMANLESPPHNVAYVADGLPDQTMNLATLICHLGKTPSNILQVYATRNLPVMFRAKVGRSFFTNPRACFEVTAKTQSPNHLEGHPHCTLDFINEEGAIRAVKSKEQLAQILGLSPGHKLSFPQSEILRLLNKIAWLQINTQAA